MQAEVEVEVLSPPAPLSSRWVGEEEEPPWRGSNLGATSSTPPSLAFLLPTLLPCLRRKEEEEETKRETDGGGVR